MDNWSVEGDASGGNSFSSSDNVKYVLKSKTVGAGFEIEEWDQSRVVAREEEVDDVGSGAIKQQDSKIAGVTKDDLERCKTEIAYICSENYFSLVRDINSMIKPLSTKLDELVTRPILAPPEPVRHLTRLDLETCLSHVRNVITSVVMSDVQSKHIKVQKHLSTLNEQMSGIRASLRELVGEAPKVVRVALDRMPPVKPAPKSFERKATTMSLQKVTLNLPESQPKAVRVGIPVGKVNAVATGLTDVISAEKFKSGEGKVPSSTARAEKKLPSTKNKHEGGDKQESCELVTYSCVLKKKISPTVFEQCEFTCHSVQELSHHRQEFVHSFEQRSDGKKVSLVDSCSGKHPHACSGITLKGEPCTYTGILFNVKRHMSTTVHTHDISFTGTTCNKCKQQYKDRWDLLRHLRGRCGAKKAARAPSSRPKKLSLTDTRGNEDQDEDVGHDKKRIKLKCSAATSTVSSRGSSKHEMVIELHSGDKGTSVRSNPSTPVEFKDHNCPACSLSFNSFKAMVSHLSRCPVYKRDV